MRNVSTQIHDIWESGDYTGSQRPFARVTVQRAGVKLTDVGYNVYASLIFGSTDKPRELPNIKSVSWQRSTDADFASGTLVFFNTAPLPLGQIPDRDLDMPGYYTYNRGVTSYGARWNQKPNEWTNTLVPDNILRTYEGYGFASYLPPERDPHLVSTGTWRIMDVEYTHDGLINVSVQDLGSVLSEQIIFPPVAPSNFYPVQFAKRPSDQKVGFIGPEAKTYQSETGGSYNAEHPPPAGWAGPLTEPASVNASAVFPGLYITWSRPTTPNTAATDTARGYQVVGYQLVINGIRDTSKTFSATTFQTTYTNQITFGNVYNVRVAAVWRELLSPKAAKALKDYVQQQVISNFSQPAIFVRPTASLNAANVTVGSTETNVDRTTHLRPGFVSFHVEHPGSYQVIAFKGDLKHVYTVTATAGNTRVDVDTGDDLGDLTTWNFLTNGSNGSGVGVADLYFAESGGEYYRSPIKDSARPGDAGQPPPGNVTITGGGTGPAKRDTTVAPPKPASPTKTTKTPTKPQAPPAKSVTTKDIRPSFSNSSNTYYTGKNGNVYGHQPDDAMDGKTGTYWLSIGNSAPSRSFAFEWIEGGVPNVTVTAVKYTSVKGNYQVYVSVFADGKWTSYNSKDVINYNTPVTGYAHNNADIPFIAVYQQGSSEGPHTITFKSPIPNATKVRITFHNLQDFNLGQFQYRAACREILVSTMSGGSGTTLPPGTPTPIKTGSATGGENGSVAKSWTEYIPAHINPGLGGTPGLYDDYTDIVKLLCAWGGFHWYRDATEILSNGDVVVHSFPPGLFGLEGVDPVLGKEGAGRVWGDFEQTGTAGPYLIPVPTWDKKSLMDGISYVREIIGFLFYIDEDGAPVWRLPNFYRIGNWVGNNDPDAGRTNSIVTIDESKTLISLRARLSGRNVRERVFVSSTDGKTAGMAVGYNPNPIGLRRVGGWTDQNFASVAECRMMADLIAVRALFTYRTDMLQIPGHPAIQIDDQVRIFEQVTGEGYLHYVKGISSSNDLESGEWNYDLETHWLGERPFDMWIFNPSDLSEETQAYLTALFGAASQDGDQYNTDTVPEADMVNKTPTPQSDVFATGGDS